MKNKFLSAFLSLGMLIVCYNCEKEESISINEQQSQDQEILEVKTYVYKGKEYKVTLDIRDEENPILLEDKNSQLITNLYAKHEEFVTLVKAEDDNIYLYDNIKAYESSNQAKNVIIENPDEGGGSGSGGSSSGDSGSSSSPQEAFFYNRSGFNPVDGALYIDVSWNPIISGVAREISDLRYIDHQYGMDLFPDSVFPPYDPFNPTTENLNDKISSLTVKGVSVRLWEHPNFIGDVIVFDARNSPNVLSISYLGNYRMCSFLCPNWNDEATSLRVYK